VGAELAVQGNEFEQKVLKSDVPVLVDFWAQWCGPCLAIAPSVDQLSSEFAGRAKVFKVDVDSDGEIAAKYNIMSIPALLVFKDGKEVDRLVGAAPKEAIAKMIERHL